MTEPEVPGDTGQKQQQPVFFEAVLYPHRSLPPQGFVILMLLLGLASFAAGVTFVMMGAWPVFGYFGLDVLLVYIAFRINYRRARQHERVRLTLDRLTVEQISVEGEKRSFEFQPYWLRIILDESPTDSNRLILTSHGRQLALGGFLAPIERQTLAEALRDALSRWRAHFNPNAV